MANDKRDENKETAAERAKRLKEGGYSNNTYKPSQDAFLDEEDRQALDEP